MVASRERTASSSSTTSTTAFSAVAPWRSAGSNVRPFPSEHDGRPWPPVQSYAAKAQEAEPGTWNLENGSGNRVPPFLFRIPCSGFPVPGSVFPVPGSRFRVPGSVFPVPCSRFRVPGSAVSFPCSVFRVPGSAVCFPTTLPAFPWLPSTRTSGGAVARRPRWRGSCPLRRAS